MSFYLSADFPKELSWALDRWRQAIVDGFFSDWSGCRIVIEAIKDDSNEDIIRISVRNRERTHTSYADLPLNATAAQVTEKVKKAWQELYPTAQTRTIITKPIASQALKRTQTLPRKPLSVDERLSKPRLSMVRPLDCNWTVSSE